MKFNFNILYGLIITLILASCATVVRPDGGPKDITPPVPKAYHPENGSMNMQSKKVVIKFDEYILLKKLTQQLVVSPPMPKKPEISISGKNLVIELPDSLRENTTYTIFFGDAIVNFKENLPVHNFEYHFSTGNVLDSLMLKGFAIKSFNNTAYEELFVMLYKSMDDSVLYKEKPYYLTKTEKNGDFYLDNLAPGKYQIFALKDANRNYIYDQDDEEVAFGDSLVIPYHHSVFEPDTANSKKKIDKPKDIPLYVFHPNAKETKLLNNKDLPPLKELFVFNRGVGDFKIMPLDFISDTIWHYEVYGQKRDSITTFFMGLKQDTINIALWDGGQALDTLEIVLQKKKKKKFISKRELKKLEKEKEKNKLNKSKTKIEKKISYKDNIRSSFPFFSEIEMRFKVPLNEYDASRIHIYRVVDTLLFPFKSESWISDTINFMRIRVRARFDEREHYRMIVQNDCFFDIYHSTNDSIVRNFTTTEMREYGSLALEVKYDEKHPLIIQLLNAKNAVIREDFISKSKKINYPYLKEGKYKIKAIVDLNDNGKWDTGDFVNRIQPEKVYFVTKTLNIRANWDTEHIWTIKD
ncbi:MAG: hypothetical protein DRI86_11500 [Bacteroidetes bacterium]|nr:MAG: hypothetical protein DRI86_11500 [Bacteroidota bacterium]